MATFRVHPNIYRIGVDENGNEIFDGSAYLSLVLLGKTLNLRWKFVTVSDGNMFRNDINKGIVDAIGGGWVGTPYS